MSETAPMSPETIKRLRRQQTPRGPLQPLRERVGALGQADDRLEKLLEELLYLAERETIFTMTLERGRLLTALNSAGYCVFAFLNVEHQMLPGVTQTTYIPVVPNFVYVYVQIDAFNSLPWWVSAYAWIDTDVPAAPVVALTRASDRKTFDLEGIIPLFRFVRYTTINNHAVNTANFLAMNNFAIMTLDAWKMLEEVYLKPIVEYVQETAEKRTGRPYP